MKAKVNLDKRTESDKMWDDLHNRMIRQANLSQKQSYIVTKYMRDLIGLRIHEIEAAVEMSYLLALIEGERFGTDVNRGAKRLMRVQQNAVEIRNEAYGHAQINANGRVDDYDGCGLAHLQVRLARYGVEYIPKLDD